jgi:2-desacetyl-2-hydroxyethyl bacteriochlorophyllide A dehydrogenase
MVSCRSLYFVGPREVQFRESALPAPSPGEVLVRTELSAISAGTEMLLYRGQFPQDMPLDETIGDLRGSPAYPLRYGYAAVGQVISLGTGVSDDWQDRHVFAFHAHESHFLARPADLLPLPPEMPLETAVFLPNMETAVSFLMDSRPVIGEQVAVFGQGVVGLLTTALLAGLPLAALVTVDAYPLRREWSLRLGAAAALDPADPVITAEALRLLSAGSAYSGADLTLELSGNPAALDMAIAVTGFDGRVLIGSWYGRKSAALNLGGHFHRSQIRLISSQVSYVAPRWRGRFDKVRRLQIARQMLDRAQPARLITHRISFDHAANAYRLLDEDPGSALQVVLDYGTGGDRGRPEVVDQRPGEIA